MIETLIQQKPKEAKSVEEELPFEAFQEISAKDAADKARFFYNELTERIADRDRSVQSLLEAECQIQTRLHEVVRAYGWFNEVGEKERVQTGLNFGMMGSFRETCR